MNRIAQSAEASEPTRSEGVDFADVIMPAAGVVPGVNSEFAREALKQLEPALELARRKNIDTLSNKLSLIVGAVRQVAHGVTDRVRFEVTESILAFQKERNEMSSKWGSFTCYPDVVEMRQNLTTLGKLYPLLDKISETIVDYSVSR